jgi:hypothetical protein
MRKLFALLLLPGLWLAGCSKPVPKTERAYGLGTNGALFLTYPAEWTNSIKRVVEKGYSFDAPFFAPTNSNDFNFMVVLVFVGESKSPTLATLKSSLATRGRDDLTNAVESAISVKELEGMTGCYFNLTDKRWANIPPPAGEFRYLTRGYVALGPLVLNLNLVSNDRNRDFPAALEVIKTARYSKEQLQAPPVAPRTNRTN